MRSSVQQLAMRKYGVPVLTAVLIAGSMGTTLSSQTLAQPKTGIVANNEKQASTPGSVPAEPASYATFFKNWVYPIADLTIKVTAGILGAYYLSRRGWRDKRKEKLIDAYMEYLDDSVSLFKDTCDSCVQTFWRLLIQKIDESVPDKEYLHDVHASFDNLTAEKSEHPNDKTAVVSQGVYTYKFCFLLGKKYYFKHVMPYERTLMQFISNNSYRVEVATSIYSDESVKESFAQSLRLISTRDRITLDRHLKSMSAKVNQLVAFRVSTDMQELVHPYSGQIAESIDRL